MKSMLSSLLSTLLLCAFGCSADDAFMNNYNNFMKDGQAFWFQDTPTQGERPGPNTKWPYKVLYWLCDFEFSSFADGSVVGYTSRAVAIAPPETTDVIASVGVADVPFLKTRPFLVTAVSTTPNNSFQGRVQAAADNRFHSFLDNGSAILPVVGSEGHDAGNTNTANTWASTGILEVISKEESAELIGYDESSMTPEACIDLYNQAWYDAHPEEETKATTVVEEPMKKKTEKSEKKKSRRRL